MATIIQKPAPRRRRMRGRLSMRITKTGEVHVRHMGDAVDDLLLLDEAVELDATLCAESTTKPVWIQIAKSGVFRGHRQGPFELNAKVFAEIVANFKASENRQVAIDFEHASELPANEGSVPIEGAPAQGWIIDLDNRGADGGLWALVEWLEPAKSYVKAKKYKFFSPAIRFGARDKVTGKPVGARLTSGALTNSPFLDGMQPLAASARGAGEDPFVIVQRAIGLSGNCSIDTCLMALEDVQGADDDTIASSVTAIRDGLRLPLTASADEVFNAAAEVIEAADETDDNEDEDDMATNTNTNKGTGSNDQATEVAELKLRNKELEGENKTLSDKVAKLETQCQEANERAITDEVETAYATYKEQKNLNDQDKDNMFIICRADAAKFRKAYPKVDPSKQHLLKDLTTQRDPSTTSKTGGKPENTDAPQVMNVRTLTDQIQRSNPTLSRVAAQNQAIAALGVNPNEPRRRV